MIWPFIEKVSNSSCTIVNIFPCYFCVLICIFSQQKHQKIDLHWWKWISLWYLLSVTKVNSLLAIASMPNVPFSPYSGHNYILNLYKFGKLEEWYQIFVCLPWVLVRWMEYFCTLVTSVPFELPSHAICTFSSWVACCFLSGLKDLFIVYWYCHVMLWMLDNFAQNTVVSASIATVDGVPLVWSSMVVFIVLSFEGNPMKHIICEREQNCWRPDFTSLNLREELPENGCGRGGSKPPSFPSLLRPNVNPASPSKWKGSLLCLINLSVDPILTEPRSRSWFCRKLYFWRMPCLNLLLSHEMFYLFVVHVMNYWQSHEVFTTVMSDGAPQKTAPNIRLSKYNFVNWDSILAERIWHKGISETRGSSWCFEICNLAWASQGSNGLEDFSRVCIKASMLT